MKQYFYIINHYDTKSGNIETDKIFLQDYEAIKWGRRLATKHREFEVSLSRQAIARTATIEYVERIEAFTPVTAEQALKRAAKYHLEAEVQHEMDHGATPEQALKEWDV